MSNVTIRPLWNQVLCRPVKHAPLSKEIEVKNPETGELETKLLEGDPDAKDPFPVARVIAVGPECKYLHAGDLVQIAEVESEHFLAGEVQAWTVEEKIRCIVEGEDPANLIEGISEEQAKARLEKLRADAEVKRALAMGHVAPLHPGAMVNGRSVGKRH